MEVLIIEDEILAAERLQVMLTQYDPEIKVLGSIDSLEDAEKWLIHHGNPDLILMDIHLSDGTSFELFERVKIDAPVIFTTAYDQYAIRAFQVNSIDYLLKPLHFNDLRKALEKHKHLFYNNKTQFPYEQMIEVIRNLKTTREYKNRFLVKFGDRLFFKNIQETSYFFADGKYVYLVSEDKKKYLIEYTLEELESLLDPHLFFRLNRKYLVKINAIKEIRTNSHGRLRIHLVPNEEGEVLVSRERVAEFKTWIDN